MRVSIDKPGNNDFAVCIYRPSASKKHWYFGTLANELDRLATDNDRTVLNYAAVVIHRNDGSAHDGEQRAWITRMESNLTKRG
jgi:hypothetical protein